MLFNAALFQAAALWHSSLAMAPSSMTASFALDAHFLQSSEPSAAGANVENTIDTRGENDSGHYCPNCPNWYQGPCAVKPATFTVDSAPFLYGGSDERAKVPNSHLYPYRCLGKLIGTRDRCIGALIGPQHVLTTADCADGATRGTVFWNEDYDGGGDDGRRPKFQRSLVRDVLLPDAHAYRDLKPWQNFAVLVISDLLGYDRGWFDFNFGMRWPDEKEIYHSGYPREKEDIGNGWNDSPKGVAQYEQRGIKQKWLVHEDRNSSSIGESSADNKEKRYSAVDEPFAGQACYFTDADASDGHIGGPLWYWDEPKGTTTNAIIIGILAGYVDGEGNGTYFVSSTEMNDRLVFAIEHNR
jgi:V8-like Glu-specific endopeptidase